MLLTSAADSTAVHKFNLFDYGPTPNLTTLTPTNQSESAFNNEINLGEVSSTTDSLSSPKSENLTFLRCTVAGFSPSEQMQALQDQIDMKFNPAHSLQSPVQPIPVSHQSPVPVSQIYNSSTTVHSPAFFTPHNMQFYHNNQNNQNNQSAQYSTQYSPPSNRYSPPSNRYTDNMYMQASSVSTTPAFPAGSLISQPDISSYTSTPASSFAHFPSLGATVAAISQTSEDRQDMNAELAAAGAVAAAAARARAVGGHGLHSVEEEVINQQKASRRQMHKICEQKRRDGLKTALETLKMTIPGCSILSDQSQQNILLKGELCFTIGYLGANEFPINQVDQVDLYILFFISVYIKGDTYHSTNHLIKTVYQYMRLAKCTRSRDLNACAKA